jgi:hypothetical protein
MPEHEVLRFSQINAICWSGSGTVRYTGIKLHSTTYVVSWQMRIDGSTIYMWRHRPLALPTFNIESPICMLVKSVYVTLCKFITLPMYLTVPYRSRIPRRFERTFKTSHRSRNRCLILIPSWKQLWFVWSLQNNFATFSKDLSTITIRLVNQNCAHISHLLYARYMPRPSYPPWFDHHNNISSAVQIIRFPIVQFSPASSLLIPLMSKQSSHSAVTYIRQSTSKTVAYLSNSN